MQDLVPHTLPMDGGLRQALAPDEVTLMLKETENVDPYVQELDDGSVVVDLAPPAVDPATLPFDVNLATVMDENDMNVLAAQLLEGIQADLHSRSEWEQTYNTGIDMLGVKLEVPSAEVSQAGSISKVYHPLLLEAVIRYQSNSMPELCPSNGPVKAKDQQPLASMGRSALVEAFEKDFNHYLTVVAKEYYPDFDRMLFQQGFGGCVVRKVYRCPLRRRPVSEFITGIDFIVSNNTISLTDCGRKTQRSLMLPATMKRMMLTGHYRDIELTQPNETPTQAEIKIKETEGINPTPQLPEDMRYTIYECYTSLDLKGFEHVDPATGEQTGLPLPYRITIDKDSRRILEIRRNWRQNDPECMERKVFVKYGLIPGFGFYDYGYIHILGNTERALTAIERQLLDAGQFANFPGLLMGKQAARQDTNVVRVPPGAAHEIDTGGMKIGDVVMALPYKEPSVVLAKLAEQIAQDASRLGGTAELPVGEGRQDAPVGTTLALLEQATKITSAVHRRNHISQQEEFEIMKQLFAEDPTALWRFAQTPQRRWQVAQEFMDINITPASDPNTSSHMQRIMRAVGIQQLASAHPDLYDQRKVDAEALKVLGVQDPESLFKPPAQPDPRIAELGMAYVQAETASAQADAQRAAADAQEKMMRTHLDPMIEKRKLEQGDLKINVEAYKAGMGGLAAAAKEPPGYASGGRVTAPDNGLSDSMNRLAMAIESMNKPKRRRIVNAPRGQDGRIDLSAVEMVEEPYEPEFILQ